MLLTPRRRAIDPMNPPPPLSAIVGSIRETYFNGRPLVVNPYFSQFFREPLVSLLWWATFLKYALASTKQIGK